MSKTFVLVHGAFHGGWTWQPVAEILRAHGHTVYTPTMPGLNADDDRAEIHLIDTVDYLVAYVEGKALTDVVLVGHSWGGFVISGAAARLARRIDRLIYWSAFVPHTGESVFDLCPPEHAEMFRAAARASSDNSAKFTFDVFSAFFMQDADHATQRLVYSLLGRQPLNTLTESLDLEDWKQLELPAVFVLSADDMAMPEGFSWVPRFSDRIPGGRVIYAPGSHEAHLTQPFGLAETFIRAATQHL